MVPQKGKKEERILKKVEKVREEVLDISLASRSVTNRIRSLKPSDEVSISDHCYITCELTDVKLEIKYWRNAIKTA